MPLESWLIGNVPGSKQAIAITDPKMVSALITKKRSLLIVGYEALEIIKPVIKLAQKIPTVATAHTVKYFINGGFDKAVSMGIVDIINRLKDSSWKGLDDKGPYELVLAIGIPYYLQSQMLSTLKHFAPSVKTISLDRFYHPNADWSFPNLKGEEWRKSINSIVEHLEK